jgi:hypothetical protein
MVTTIARRAIDINAVRITVNGKRYATQRKGRAIRRNACNLSRKSNKR